MVRPAHFGYNPHTADSNHFQKQATEFSARDTSKKAQAEFDRMVTHLQQHRIDVVVIEDTGQHIMPDAVFPNNWISFHADGTVVYYPMLAAQRRLERKLNVLDPLQQNGFIHTQIVDFTDFEAENQFLEGTGSLVLDRVNKIAYTCHSSRSHLTVMQAWADKLKYRILCFDAEDLQSFPIYHTNVMLSLSESFAIICSDTVKNPQQNTTLLTTLAQTGHEIIEINQSQLNQFSANAYAIFNRDKELMLIMSDTAYYAFNSKQKKQLSNHCSIIHIPIPTIEHCGGGSARCMLAGIHLPRKDSL